MLIESRQSLQVVFRTPSIFSALLAEAVNAVFHSNSLETRGTNGWSSAAEEMD